MANRWKIFAVLAVMFIVGFFYRVSMAVISADLARDLGLTAAELGVASAVFFYAFALAQIPLGPILDQYGGRLVITGFGVITTCGALTFALAPNFLTAVAGRALLGLGTASVLMGSLKIFTNWFSDQEFPRVSGYLLSAGSIGSVSATAPLAFAISVFTWRPTFVAMAIAQALATVLVYLMAQDAPTGPTGPSSTPTESPGEELSIVDVWRLLAKSPDFWLISLMAFFWYANYMVLLSLWGGPYLREALRLSHSESGITLLCTSAGYICGAGLLGKVIDRFRGSLEKTILAGQTALLILMTVMLGPAEHLAPHLLRIVFFLIGIVSASGVMIYPLARRLVPRRSAATAMTCVNFFLLLGAASMQHVMGHYISTYQRTPAGYPAAAYHGAFLIPICGLAGIVALFYLRKTVEGFDIVQESGDAGKEAVQELSPLED